MRLLLATERTMSTAIEPRGVCVAAVVLPGERSRLDAAGSGYFRVVHGDSIAEVVRTVRERPVDAVLVSVHRCAPEQVTTLGYLTRNFPDVSTVALLSRYDPDATESLLRLGASGVRQVVDLTAPGGWTRLRALVSQPVTPAAARIQGPLFKCLTDVPPDARLFFEATVRLAPDTPTVVELARRLHVRSSTLMSRFARAGLPSPKNYLAAIRLVHAAFLFETRGFSVADVAYRLDYSSPQSFGRHLRAMQGITAMEFRRRFPFAAALDRFLAVMIVPYLSIWRGFHPLGHPDREPASP